MSEAINRAPAHLPDPVLRRSLEETIGHDAAANALRLAGHEAGDAIHALLQPENDDHAPANPLADLDGNEFWRRLRTLFADRGWGTMEFDDLHPGLGALESADWAEADPEIPASRPACHFTVGMIANLLGRVANAEVGVIESECRSRGDLHCRFLFGGRVAVESFYAEIRTGRSTDEALASLG